MPHQNSTKCHIKILPNATSKFCQTPHQNSDKCHIKILPNATFGLIFETLCVRDLRVYADALNGTVYHYRDKNNLECDAVVHLGNGSYGLIEIKLGGNNLINEGAANLLVLANNIDTTKMKKPSFLMVLTGVGEYAYKRPEDGVLVVPIGCLKN
ncbi:MAG: DUF4143 domain-containing protein [Bacteroidales bacterium]|nr:DUF4143 domain-containing protein [Candidatus Scybalocola fimicaballi]